MYSMPVSIRLACGLLAHLFILYIDTLFQRDVTIQCVELTVANSSTAIPFAPRQMLISKPDVC